ncbi:hypothetical protein [Microbacterium sp. PRC9]|uniref:hypothetical protein n=1 Tax=Microbacterium sp. PRC9 TaxID=2962591 RepID=UPI002882B598|nr:hypothetical protein [Microbacterium sp. PRC9]MDT0144833.1 hypothetical protein [Microbacterium sp. PRC9]
MTLRTRWCAYPWDFVDAPDAPARARDSGADGIALAAAYHAVRAATPTHPRHRVVEASFSAFYLPVRPAIWRGQRLQPRRPGRWVDDQAFEQARDAARAAGLEVEAWIVLTHDDSPEERNLDYRARNAFGDAYPYALCPSNADVREYCATLTSETVQLSGASSLMIEACGPMGVEHVSAHEKTSGAGWTPVDAQLLSVCFCAACERALAAAGLDVGRLRGLVTSGVGRGAEHIEEVLGEAATAVLDVRAGARRQLATAVADAARAQGAVSLAFHAQATRWSTGPFAALLDTFGLADCFVFPGEHIDASDLAQRSRGERIGAYISLLPPESIKDLVAQWEPTLRHVDDLYLYHLGLTSQSRAGAASLLIEALRRTKTPRPSPSEASPTRLE